MENRIQEIYETASESACEAIESLPLASVAAAFGAGLLAGLVVVNLFSESKSRSTSWTDWSEWQATHYGKQLMDKLGALAPSSWKS